MGKLQIPENYTPVIDYMESQRGNQKNKRFFSAGTGIRTAAATRFRAAVRGSGDRTER